MKQKSKKTSVAKKIVIAIVAVAVLGIIAFGIVNAIMNSDIPTFDDGSELSAVELTTAGGVVYEWTLEFENSDIAEVIEKTSKVRDPNLDGGPIDLKYIIKGKKPGRTKLACRYGSFIDGHILETRNYLVEVNNKLEVRITEQN